MTTRRTTPRAAVDDLRAELLSDLHAEPPVAVETSDPTRPVSPLPGSQRLDVPRQGPALELRVTPTRWSLLRRTDRGLKVGPVSVGLRRG